MLVKKVKPEWQPSEKPGIAVGETIDITDPKELIISSYVVAVDDRGVEKSPFEMYGVITPTERAEMEEFVKMKKANATKARLEAQNAELKKQVEAAKAESEKEAVTESAPKTTKTSK